MGQLGGEVNPDVDVNVDVVDDDEDEDDDHDDEYRLHKLGMLCHPATLTSTWLSFLVGDPHKP